MSDEVTPPATSKPAPWRGRPRVENPRKSWVHIRVTADERVALEAAAERVEMHLGPYIVSAALNAPKRRSTRKPAVERVALAQLLGFLGRASGNVNQIARAMNMAGSEVPFDVAETIAELRAAGAEIMQALGRTKRSDSAAAD